MVARTLASWQCEWVEFVVSFCFAIRVSLQVIRFSSLEKINTSKFQSDQERGPTSKFKADVASFPNNLVI